ADSGMVGTETTEHPDAFCNIDPHVVAADLAEQLADEHVHAVIGYDDNGTYGHPDHEQVHAVAHAAARPLAASWVLDATYNREYLASLPDSDGLLDPNFAAAEADLTHFVAGEPWMSTKIEAIMHHRSQIPDDWDRENPDVDGFRRRFGTEWFIAEQVTTAPEPGAEFGLLADVLQPKAAWEPPLERDGGLPGQSSPSAGDRKA
ncbi:MAG: hypothetical protein OEV40_12695, partial [Acidimicrobiia bacterium]|nr:hypothetical protein [Acidimicrobiia bacterium]